MSSLTLKQHEQILQQMISAVVARTDLSDVTDASSVKHLLSSVSRQFDQLYYQLSRILDIFNFDTAVGDDLDARAKDLQPYGLTRLPATKATGTLVFSRPTSSGTIVIPAGTVGKTADGVRFVTSEAGSIDDGETESAAIACTAAEGGSAGNVDAGTVVKFEARPSGVTAVTNPSTMVGGTDKESDDAFRARIKAFISTLARSTVKAIEFAVIGLSISTGQRISFSHVFEDPLNRGEVTLYVDDGSGTIETNAVVLAENLSEGFGGPELGGDSCVGGEEFLFTDFKPVKDGTFALTSTENGALVDGTDYAFDVASGRVKLLPATYPDGAIEGESFFSDYVRYTGLIELAQKVIDGDPDDRTNFPGWRAAGVRVIVVPPTVLQQVVEGYLFVKDGFVKADVIAEVEVALSAYVNNLGISGDVLRSELIAAAMSVDGVYNFNLISPSNDVIILDDQLPRLTLDSIDLS